MKTKCQYNHTTCNKIDTQDGAQGGAGAIIQLDDDYILLGYDNYLKAYSICTGKRSAKETCYIETIEREMLEEFKICISSLESTNKNVFCETNENFTNGTDDNNSVKFVVIGRTPIFIGSYTFDEIDVESFNKKIEEDNENADLPRDFKEIGHLTVCLKTSIKRVTPSLTQNIDKSTYTIVSKDNVVLPLSNFTYMVLSSLYHDLIE